MGLLLLLERWLGEIDLIKHLIVFPTGRWLLVAREHCCVSALKVNERRVGGEKFWVKHGIVESVVVMRENLSGVHPWALRSGRFSEPDFSKK
jgi:hypothetical protein